MTMARRSQQERIAQDVLDRDPEGMEDLVPGEALVDRVRGGDGKISIPAARVPKFSAGSALRAAVRRGPE